MGNQIIPEEEERWTRVLDNKAPERLRGKEILLILNKKQMRAEINMPDDPTEKELRYFKWVIEELIHEAGLDLNKIKGPFMTEPE